MRAMVSLCGEEECRFFDAHDNIGSLESEPGEGIHGCDDLLPNDFRYHVWATAPKSVHQRKNAFFRLMGLPSNEQVLEVERDSVDEDDVAVLVKSVEVEDNRVLQTSGAVLRNAVEEADSSISFSSNSTEAVSCSSRIHDSNGEEDRGNVLVRTDTGTGIVSAPMVQKLVDRDRHIKIADTMVRTMNRVKGRLGSLRSMGCMVHKPGRSDSIQSCEVWQKPKAQRIRVRKSKKRLKELSAVFMQQDIEAHQGAILTMKFSLDGRYLASAGEDAVVRVWQAVEDERSNDIDIPDVDQSCLYFTVNNLSQLAPLMAAKQKISKLKSLRKTKNSACVVFPPKIFRILENPVHEFHGHRGDVLDLSWSKDNFLLSSSVDETVRLWRIGSDECLKVFPHSNYVTCVQFQPMDENYFVSGSIDGKVRVWSVSGCQVVDWIDVREIVTAVAYSPDGKGGVIGSMTGCCSFFSLSNNRFQLEDSVSLSNKKKSPCKRIIGFQFCPQDPSKVMVSCADSHVRILNGVNIIGKFRGQRNAGNPLGASFTSDGKHIVSASEDSNVYVWNCYDQKGPSFSRQKTVRSYECFSATASVAKPWPGFKVRTNKSFPNSLPPCYFSLGPEYLSKGSATWPEEKLPLATPSTSPLCKSRYKFFRSSCQSSYGSHTWGLVIVTAGWDGRIRSFLNFGLPATV